MYVKIYSFKPLDPDTGIRKDFELPAWPYTTNQDHYAIFIKYLKSLNIFSYEDSIQEFNGAKTNYSIQIPLDLNGEEKFWAYRSEVVLDDNDFTVKDFPPSYLQSSPIGKVNKFYGDNKAWYAFNIPGQISYWNTATGAMKFEEATELIHENCNPKCYKPK